MNQLYTVIYSHLGSKAIYFGHIFHINSNINHTQAVNTITALNPKWEKLHEILTLIEVIFAKLKKKN